MSDEEKGVMDESLASEEAAEEETQEETAEETVEEEKEKEDKGQVANLNRAVAAMRRENKLLREELNTFRQQQARPKEEEADPFPVDDEAYLKAGDVKKLVQGIVKKSAPSPAVNRELLADILSASEAIAMIRHEDYAEVVEEFREELDDDPNIQAFVIGKPGTHMNAGERLYQFALMRKGQNGSGTRKATIDAVVNRQKKPATMGVTSKKASSTAFNPVGKTLDEIREFKKKNPDAYKKAMGEGTA